MSPKPTHTKINNTVSLHIFQFLLIIMFAPAFAKKSWSTSPWLTAVYISAPPHGLPSPSTDKMIRTVCIRNTVCSLFPWDLTQWMIPVWQTDVRAASQNNYKNCTVLQYVFLFNTSFWFRECDPTAEIIHTSSGLGSCPYDDRNAMESICAPNRGLNVPCDVQRSKQEHTLPLYRRNTGRTKTRERGE